MTRDESADRAIPPRRRESEKESLRCPHCKHKIFGWIQKWRAA